MKTMKSNPAKTVLTISVGFLLVYMATKMKWALTTAFLVGVAGIASNYLAEKIEWVWMKLTLILSKIVPNVLLGVIFYVFLFPIALFSRLFGKKDPLLLRNTSASTFRKYDKQYTAVSFDNPW